MSSGCLLKMAHRSKITNKSQKSSSQNLQVISHRLILSQEKQCLYQSTQLKPLMTSICPLLRLRMLVKPLGSTSNSTADINGLCSEMLRSLAPVTSIPSYIIFQLYLILGVFPQHEKQL